MVATNKKQLYIVAYDISNDKRRRKIVTCLEKHGIRINKSVFECMLTKAQLDTVVDELEMISIVKSDSIAIYPICAECYAKTRYIPKHLRIIPKGNTIVVS